MEDVKTYVRDIWGGIKDKILEALMEHPNLVAQMVKHINEGDNCTTIAFGTDIIDEKGEHVARVIQQIKIDIFKK